MKKAAKRTGAAAAEAPASGPLAQVFGVRHLSPMGAWHLRGFIARVEPTAILIEGPADADPLLVHLAHKKTRPPVAVLAFTKQRPVRSILYPLASYSPEWVALTEGLSRKIPVRFMDLPAATFIALHEQYRAEDARASAGGKPAESAPDPAATSETQAYLDDPFELIAQVAGDPDHETWWERHFEHNISEGAYRDAIHEFGAQLRALRRDAPRRERETLTREAYMRRVIRETIAAGHAPEKIVVVCGAFHAPVLTAEEHAMTDAELAALPAMESTLTIMPYSYYRLSAQSGYGAGNHAPGYYQALWEEVSNTQLERLPVRFLAELAGSLRRSGNVRSSAEVIEAVRLATAMAALSGGASAPTLRDLRDAAATCLAGGEAHTLAKHLSEVEVGAAIGAVPPGVARTAIQDDFYHLLKGLKLDEYLKDKEQPIKGKAADGALDLREDRFTKSADAAFRDRNRSIFLHRLALLGIPFAKKTGASDDDSDETDDDDDASSGRRVATSTFKEYWAARWTPECEITLAENSLRGDTIEVAAVRRFQEDLAVADDVGAAAQLARRAVECDLQDAMNAAVARVQAVAVDDGAIASVASAVYDLAALTRYREVRQVNVEPLKPLVAQLFLRAALLATSAAHCDEDAARKVGRAFGQLQHVATVEDAPDSPLATERWFSALNTIADDDAANPFLSGAACALLLERGLVTDDTLDQRVARRLSPGMDPGAGAGFFEGLASRNRMALLSRRRLWTALSDFVESLDDSAFRRAVVGLRRAFASFEAGEARRIAEVLAELWKGGGAALTAAIETKLDDAELARLQDDLAGLGDLDL